ncbi:MAG: hypothetical protein K2O58_06930 [Bacteroidales bacterium]|nr:hypothetical protein [Bacteroidales bacterium]MDE6872523.1 hypothetical protein [Bacteroidales bacterium]MDE7127608.1 hypothetical protein [Bacteroidales bacterium]
MSVDDVCRSEVEVKNDLDVRVTLDSYIGGSVFQVGIEPGEKYSYWIDPTMGTAESGKILVDQSDSLDIYFEPNIYVRLYSSSFADRASPYCLYNYWTSAEYLILRFVINEDVRALCY